MIDIIKKITQSKKSGQATDQSDHNKIVSLTEGLDEESMLELRKYITFLHARQKLDNGEDESSAGLDGNAGK